MANSINIATSELSRVMAAGIHKVDQPWKHRYRKVPVNTMLFVYEGTLYVNEDEVNYTVPKNHIMFFEANAVQKGYKYIDAGAKWFWVNFLEEDDQRRREDYVSFPKVIKATKIHELHQQLNLIVELYLSHEHLKQERMNSAFYQIILSMIVGTYKQESRESTRQISPKVIDLLKTQIYQKFDSNAIGESMSMNYKYISRKFKSETGSTIKHYYLTMKINESILLLQTSSKNISEISEILNFPNPYYFSRVFKDIRGVSPNNYKKQMYQS